MFSFRRLRVFSLVLALALVAGACGGGDSTSETTTTIASGDGGGTGASDSTTSTTAEPASGDSSSTWCDRIREFQETDAESPISFNFFGLTAAQLEAQFETNIEVYEEWAGIAPSEIDDAVDIVLNAFRTLFDRAKAANWSFIALADDPEFAAAFEDPAFDKAANDIDNYNRDVCGVDFGLTADPGAGPPGGGDPGDDPIAIALNAFQLPASLFSEDDIECMRSEVGAEFEATITADWVPNQADINVLLTAIDACEISLGG